MLLNDELILNCFLLLKLDYYMKFFTPKLNLSDEDLNRKYRIPRLEDVFKHLPPRMRFNIDVKAINDELMHKVNELIIKYEKEDQIVWGSFKYSLIDLRFDSLT